MDDKPAASAALGEADAEAGARPQLDFGSIVENPRTKEDGAITDDGAIANKEKLASKQDGQASDEDDNLANDMQHMTVEKKKRKPKSKKAKKPTGFEEYYVDAPVTPAEFEEERSIYDLSRPFTQRLQTAIQRYVARRKFDNTRKDVFDSYMSYGGVDSGQKMFTGGLDAKTLEQSNAAEIAEITATNYISDDKQEGDDSDFVVDFDGVLKGFLSSRLPQSFDLTSPTDTKSHIAVIRNFLNYLLHHDVCPEYVSQINDARKTCNLADIQLPACHLAGSLLPGDFNVACSIIFGGYHSNTYLGDAEWAREMDIPLGMSPDHANKVFKAGFAAHGEDYQHDKYNRHVRAGKIRVLETIETSIEIIELLPPDPAVRNMYSIPSMSGLSPLGKMKAVTWTNPNDSPLDLTAEEIAANARHQHEKKVHVIWAEEDLLAACFVGMKMQVQLRSLSFGIQYLDHVRAVFCGFYEVLPNELMLGWRKHEYLPPRKEEDPWVDGDGDGDGDREENGNENETGNEIGTGNENGPGNENGTGNENREMGEGEGA